MSANLWSQKEDFSLTTHGQVLVPRFDFAQAVPDDNLGLEVTALVRGKLLVLPVKVGVSYSWTSLERNRTNVLVDVNNEYMSDAQMLVKNNINELHGVVRFDPFGRFAVSPYVDFMAGTIMNSARQTTNLEYNHQVFDRQKDNIHFDYTWSYGFNGGLMLRLNRVMNVDMRVQFLKGGELEYVVPNNTAIYPDGGVGYVTTISRTNRIKPQIGLTFKF